MPKPPGDEPDAWVIQEETARFRILDATGRVLAEIPFADDSPAKVSRSDAHRMAENMIEAARRLARANLPTKD